MDYLSGSGHFSAPTWVFDDNNLSVKDKIVALYLCRCGVSHAPSTYDIARACGISQDDASVAVGNLQFWGYLTGDVDSQ